jgi:hypothetical protein
MSDDALLTEDQLAKRWQISTGSLANDRSLGRGVPYLKIGRAVRYDPADVREYEQARRRTPAAA